MEPRWKDLEDKGFLIVPQFLSGEEIAWVREDYDARTNASREDGLSDLEFAPQELIGRFETKLQNAADAVLSAAGVHTDITVSGVYFAIERGIDFPWHQDDGSYFLFQNHYNFLNFYVPIVKPEATKSNVSVIPFDALQKASPEFYARLKGGGATSFLSNGSETSVSDYDSGTEYKMPFDIDRLAVTPDLTPGDLLLFRGDTIHRTQDTTTFRVAISFRRVSSKTIVRSARFTGASRLKRDFMTRTKPVYDKMFECFATQGSPELSVGELFPHIRHFLMPDRLRRFRTAATQE